MVHGGMTLVKYLLFLFNFVFWLTGVCILIMGTVIQVSYRQYVNVLGNDFLAAPILLICVGSVITVLGFFGCCGAIRENYCMTMTFAVLLGVIFIVEMAAGIAGYVLHKVHEHFECCGALSYNDWSNATRYKNTAAVPDSCCLSVAPECAKTARLLTEEIRNATIYTEGCVPKVEHWIQLNVAIVGGIGAGVAAVQFGTLVIFGVYSWYIEEVRKESERQIMRGNYIPYWCVVLAFVAFWACVNVGAVLVHGHFNAKWNATLAICFACCLSKSILKDYEEYYY